MKFETNFNLNIPISSSSPQSENEGKNSSRSSSFRLDFSISEKILPTFFVLKYLSFLRFSSFNQFSIRTYIIPLSLTSSLSLSLPLSRSLSLSLSKLSNSHERFLTHIFLNHSSPWLSSSSIQWLDTHSHTFSLSLSMSSPSLTHFLTRRKGKK